MRQPKTQSSDAGTHRNGSSGVSAASGGSLPAPFDFGKIAKRYDQWYGTPQGRLIDSVQKTDVLTLLPCPQPGDRLLDAGCGTGHWSRFFAHYGYEVAGIDISPEMIQIARQRCPSGCTFEVADAAALPFPDEYFDVVASVATIGFVADAPAVIREMFRCLKTGGTMLIGALNRISPLNRQRLAAGKQPYASGRLLGPGQLRRMLKTYGNVCLIASDRTIAGNQKHQSVQSKRSRLTGTLIVARVRK